MPTDEFFPFVSSRQLVAIALSLALITGMAVAAPRTSADATGLSLKVQSLVQSVPADGKTYGVLAVSIQSSSGQPIIATSTFTVLVSSSNVGVGTVQGNFSFLAGRTFMLANLTTTSTPGSTVITASAQGYQPGSAQVQTQELSGFPVGVQVFAAPPRAVAQASYTGKLIVELVDARGDPAEAPSNTPITLSSSAPQIVSPSNGTLVVPRGSALAMMPYQTGLFVGPATISATAVGFSSSSTTVTVVGSPPAQLRALASTNPAPPNTNQVLVVWLLGPSGNPAPAPTNITVSISNSNLSEVEVPDHALIQMGTSYVDVPFRTMSATGLPAKLTITSGNLTSTSVEIQVLEPSASPGQGYLKLDFAPQTVLANGKAYTAAFVDLSLNGRPAVASTYVGITLTSNNVGVMGVNNSIWVFPGSSFAIATIQTSYEAGTAQITASALNYLSVEEQVTAYGAPPSLLSLSLSPAVLPATGEGFPALNVGLASASGQPVDAPSNVSLRVVSSDQSVVPINETISIPPGASSALVQLPTTSTPGRASITVSGQGYPSATTSVSTVIPTPSALKLIVDPQPGLQTPLNPITVMGVQLLDGEGNPVQTTVPIQVTVTGSNTSVLTAPMSVTFPVGGDLELVPMEAEGMGSVQLTATSPGLLPASASAQFLPYPLVTTINGSASEAPVNDTVLISVTAFVQGAPVQGATVSWTTDNGSLSSSTSVTGSNGTASDYFVSHLPGGADIGATLQVPGFTPAPLMFHVETVKGFPASSGGGGFLGLNLQTIVLAAAVTAVVVMGVALGTGRLKSLKDVRNIRKKKT